MPDRYMTSPDYDRISRGELSKYSVSAHSYPLDLFQSREYGENYVAIYININEDSKLYRTGGDDVVLEDSATILANRRRGGKPDEPLNNARTIAGASAATVAAAGYLSGAGDKIGAILFAATAGSVLEQKGIFSDDSGTPSNLAVTRQQKRLKTAIALHIPHNLRIEYRTEWEEITTALLTGLIEGGDAAGDALKATWGGLTSGNAEPFGEAIKNNFSRVTGLLANVALTTPISGNPLSVATGLQANPKKEQLFRGIGFREFVFDYQFFPRSRAEAEAVRNIIFELKYHMAPEYKEESSFLFVYPSEFDIAYYQGGALNQTLHRHPSCVLTNLLVNYTPNANFTTFDDQHEAVRGMPPQINVTMTFKELALITKELVKEGY